MKKFVVIMLTLVMVFTSSIAFAAGDPEATTIIVDTLLLRPVGLASLGVGTAMYVVALPFALITGSHGSAFDALVKEPFKYVFVRPVGDIGSGI